MRSRFQKLSYGSFTVSGRVDSDAYESMINLMHLAGYKDVSSFVREAVLGKCELIASNVADAMASKRHLPSLNKTKNQI